MGKWAKFIRGSLAGAFIGVAAALFLTPAGEDIKNEALARWQTIQEEARRAAAEQRERLEEELARLRGEQL